MSESSHQQALIKWWDSYGHKQYSLPPMALYATPNGGARSALTGVILNREGVRKGVWDLCLPVPRNGFNALWLEMKFGKNKLSPEQVVFGDFVRGQLCKTAVCYDWEAAKVEIENYLK